MIALQRTSREQLSILFDRNLTDLMKFVACVMVAMSHYSGYALASLGQDNIVYKIISSNCGYLGVAFFFLLSGYGLMMSEKKSHLTFVSFIKKRLSRTYLPAVLVSVLWLGANLVLNEIGGGNLLCNQNYLLGVVWQFNDEVLWFVRTIIVMYAFFYVFCFIDSWSIRRGYSQIWSFLSLLFIGIIATIITDIAALGDPISVPLFFIGVSIAKWPKDARYMARSWILLLLVCSVMAIVAYLFRTDNRVLHGVINYFCMAVFLSLLAYVNIRVANIPKWIGGCSYDIYLVHWKVHLLLVFLFGVEPLWMFATGSAIAIIGFYHLRKLCKV